MRSRRFVAAALVAFTLAPVTPALAGPEGPVAPERAAPSAAAKEEARARFEQGLRLLQERAWDAALAEFARSRELYATRAATKNAAICLRELHRYDEALEMVEALVREFPDLPPDEKSVVAREMSELRSRVGSVDIQTVEGGATVVIDGRTRGSTPLTGPVRVAAGSHLVRVYKEGFAPFEARVEIAGGRTLPLEVRLSALQKSGRLVVREQSTQPVEVFVDSVAVGPAPWSGTLAVGRHTVALRGEEQLGTQPVAVEVREGTVETLTLSAEVLDASLRVEPVPINATVAIDGVSTGAGIWEGRLRSGQHRVEVAAEGFLPSQRTPTLRAGSLERLVVPLERDPTSSLWRAANPPAFTFTLRGGGAFGPTLGSELSAGCTAPCDASSFTGGAAMLGVGYRFSSGLGLGLDAGALAGTQQILERSASLQPRGLESSHGTTNDKLVARAVLLGAAAELQKGEAWTWGLRLGAGLMLVSITDTRSGTFTNALAPAGPTPYTVGPLRESADGQSLYLLPSVQGGRRFGPFVVSVGVGGLVAFALSRPTWSDERRALAGDCTSTTSFPTCLGQATFGPEALAGRAMFLLLPEVSLRYELR